MGKFLLSMLCAFAATFSSLAADVVLDVSKNTNSWMPTGSNASEVEKQAPNGLKIKFGKDTYFNNQGYLFIKKNGFISLSLPIACEKITLTTTGNQGANCSVSIKVADQVIAGPVTMEKSKEHEFIIPTNNQAVGTVYQIINTSSQSKNAQITKITFKEAASPVDPTKCATPVVKIADKVVTDGDRAFVNDELTFSCSTEGAVITYSLDGGGLNVVDAVYDNQPIKLPKTGIYNITASAKAGELVSDVLKINDIDVLKRNAGISFTQDAATAYLDAVSEFKAPELSNPNNLEGIIYTSLNPEIASVTTDGTVTPLAVGETTITAKYAGNDEYEGAEAKYTLTVQAEKPVLPKYKKITSADELEAGAKYVIAYENPDGSVAMSIDVENDYRHATNVTISDGILEATENTLIITLEGTTDNWKFNAENYSGTEKYFKFNQTNTTKIFMVSEADATVATISFSAQGNVQIQGNVDGGSRYIKYNKDTNQFRYYANSNGVMCQLYRQIIETPVEPEAPAKPELHPELAGMLSGTSILAKEGETIKFADVEEHINLYYKISGGSETPEPAALAETEHNHDGYTLYDKVNGIELTQDHDGKTLEVIACDSNTGKHSEPALYSLSVSTVGVAEIEAAGTGEVRWFDMQGREVKGQPEKGVYVRVANGKASKVIVK